MGRRVVRLAGRHDPPAPLDHPLGIPAPAAETAILFALLGFPFGANLDTGNINLQLTLMLWARPVHRPGYRGLLWAVATWMKWLPVVFWPILSRGRRWGLVCLRLDRPRASHAPADDHPAPGAVRVRRPTIRLDYLVSSGHSSRALRRPEPFGWLRPSWWARASPRCASRRGRFGQRLREYLGFSSWRRDQFRRNRAPTIGLDDRPERNRGDDVVDRRRAHRPSAAPSRRPRFR